MRRHVLAAVFVVAATPCLAHAQVQGLRFEGGPVWLTRSGSVHFGTSAIRSNAGVAVRGRLRYGVGALAVAGEVQTSFQGYDEQPAGPIDTLDTTSWNGAYEIDLAAGTTNFGEIFTNFENLVTGNGADIVTGTAGANDISTRGGIDTVNAGAGNDVVAGGADGDTLDGGADFDILNYRQSNGAVTINLQTNSAAGGQRGFGADISASASTTQGGLVSDADKKLADAYAGIFRAFVKHRDSVKMVTFWGVNDAVSWRAQGKPLLFDGENRPKPAFDAVIRAAGGEPLP